MVFDPYFFVAEKPLPTTRTHTVVNFHSLFGQFGSLVLNRQNQVTSVGLWKKIAFSREIQRENLKISCRRNGTVIREM